MASLAAQSLLTAGRFFVLPNSLTIFRQPVAAVQAPSLKCDRYVARSEAAVGSPKADTTATVAPLPPVVAALASAYALRRLAGV